MRVFVCVREESELRERKKERREKIKHIKSFCMKTKMLLPLWINVDFPKKLFHFEIDCWARKIVHIFNFIGAFFSVSV